MESYWGSKWSNNWTEMCVCVWKSNTNHEIYFKRDQLICKWDSMAAYEDNQWLKRLQIAIN